MSYTTIFTVDQTPAEAFAAITDPRGWWSEEIEGGGVGGLPVGLPADPPYDWWNAYEGATPG